MEFSTWCRPNVDALLSRFSQGLAWGAASCRQATYTLRAYESAEPTTSDLHARAMQRRTRGAGELRCSLSQIPLLRELYLQSSRRRQSIFLTTLAPTPLRPDLRRKTLPKSPMTVWLRHSDMEICLRQIRRHDRLQDRALLFVEVPDRANARFLVRCRVAIVGAALSFRDVLLPVIADEF